MYVRARMCVYLSESPCACIHVCVCLSVRGSFCSHCGKEWRGFVEVFRVKRFLQCDVRPPSPSLSPSSSSPSFPLPFFFPFHLSARRSLLPRLPFCFRARRGLAVSCGRASAIRRGDVESETRYFVAVETKARDWRVRTTRWRTESERRG